MTKKSEIQITELLLAQSLKIFLILIFAHGVDKEKKSLKSKNNLY